MQATNEPYAFKMNIIVILSYRYSIDIPIEYLLHEDHFLIYSIKNMIVDTVEEFELSCLEIGEEFDLSPFRNDTRAQFLYEGAFQFPCIRVDVNFRVLKMNIEVLASISSRLMQNQNSLTI